MHMERLLSGEENRLGARNIVREIWRRGRMHQINSLSKSLPSHGQTPDSKVRVETDQGVTLVNVVKRGHSHTGEYLTTESTTQISHDKDGRIIHLARTAETRDGDGFPYGSPLTSEYDPGSENFDPQLLKNTVKDLQFARSHLAVKGLN